MFLTTLSRTTTSLALLCLCLGCPQPPPPAPTVATLRPSRAGVTLQRGGATEPAPYERRVEAGAEVRTPPGVRAALTHDSGAWVLLDGGAAVAVPDEGTLELRAGRAWIDARHTDPVKVKLAGGQVLLTLQDAGLALSLGKDGGAEVYCAAGQATWQAGSDGPDGPDRKTGGRLESGLSLIWKDGKARETAQALWEDWTLGLAEPGPLRPPEPAGVGQLLGRRPGQVGEARRPLIIRQHEVRVKITADLATTEVEQTFFNPRSELLEGVYAVRLPERAILEEFALGEEGGEPETGTVAARRRGAEAVTSSAAQLEWAGPGRYRGLLREIPPGKTRVVRLRYVEWLSRHPAPLTGRRSYVYPMGQSAAGAAGEVPNLGEFSLEVDLTGAGAGAIEAGMGAQVEGRRVVLRRSDFRPRADFVLDLLDASKDKKAGAGTATAADPARATPAYRGRGGDGASYLLAQPVLDPGPPPARLDLVLVLDVSAATDEARLDLARTAARALLQQLRPEDRVAVLAASLSARSLGPPGQPALAEATPARVEALLDALAKEAPGGATDLGGALARAVELLPPGQGQGTIIYLGDGRPTIGQLLPGELRAHLNRLGALPRLYAVALGAGADVDLLAGICDGGAGAVLRVEDRPEAVRAALHLLLRAARPALSGVQISLGEGADVVYPEGQVTLEGGQPLQVLARLSPGKQPPGTLVVTGVRAGAPFRQELKLTLADAPPAEERGDISRRWAQERLLRLLARGAGREAAVDIGLRHGLVTPWTALIVRGGGQYAQALGEEEQGFAFVPPALRGQAPQDSPLALEGGVSTAAVGILGMEQLYERALAARQATARLCYVRKAAGHPELSGRVVLKVKIAADGSVAGAQVLSSTLRAPDVEACMVRAVQALRLPAAPDGKPHEVSFALQLEQPEGDEGSRSCSAASRAYLAVRRALWGERLARQPGPAGAMAVWREARARCELRTWVDRRALLDLMRPASGRTVMQVDLYHRLDGDPDGPEAQEYLRREILRGVRTPEDVQAAQAGLSLSGGIDPQLLLQELGKAKGLAGQIAVVRQFLQLQPGALALKVRLMGLLDQAGQAAEARRLADSLRADPGADAGVRQAVGELLLRQGEGAEAARALSEIVEFAPFDPWGRRRLGDLYRAHRMYEAAYREYQVLAWLLPQDESVPILLAGAAFGAGRSDEGLRLLSRAAEAVGAHPAQGGPAAWARAAYAVRLWQLIDEARRRGDQNLLGQLMARGRSDGIAGYGGKLLVALTFAHPDAGLQLLLSPPEGAKDTRAAIQGGAVGIEAQRYDRLEGGDVGIVVRRAEAAGQGQTYEGEVLTLYDEGLATERLRRTPVKLTAGQGQGPAEVRLVLHGGDVREAK
jgi:tetratricopeptide (TPR) repeat protein